jgi:hypothetical protein
MNEFEILDGAGGFVAQPHPNRSRVELVWNGVSTVELTFDDDSDALAAFTDDARVRVHRDGEVLLTGKVDTFQGTGPVGSTTVVFKSDFADLGNLGWQNPTQEITDQSSEYARFTGPTETVVKSVCALLSDRLGYGWVVPPSTGLGSEQRVEFRMHPLTDKLLDMVKADLLTWSLVDGVLDVTEGALFDSTLTVDSGVIESFQWSRKAPTATRVVVGGSDASTSREFGLVVDEAREARWGRVVEVFRSASLADGESLLVPGVDALKETGPVTSVSVNLIEASWFRYGIYRLGDRVRLRLGPLETTDVISRVVFEDGPDIDEVVTPHIGTLETSTEGQLAAAVGKLARGLRDVGRR